MTFLTYTVLVAIASFNRETSAFLVLLYLAYYGLSRWREVAVLGAIWVLVTGGLHVVIGSHPHQLGLVGTLTYNVNTLPQTAVVVVTLLPLALAALGGYRRAPSLLRRLAWVGMLYVGAIAVGASWSESLRLVIPVMPLILPLITSPYAGYPRKTLPDA